MNAGIRSGLLPDVGSAATKLQVVNPLELTQWDDLVGNLPGYNAFHSQGWAAVLYETYQHQPMYLCSMEGGKLDAVLPLVEVNTWLRPKRGICLPFTDECAPLLRESSPRVEGTGRELFDAALQLGRAREWKSLEVRGRCPSWETLPVSISCYSHVLDLRPTEVALFGSFESSVRRAIRKGASQQVHVRTESDCGAVMAYYQLHCKTRRRHGLPPQPRSFFRAIHRHLIEKGQGFIVLAEHRGCPVAGAVFLISGKRAIFKFGASDEEFQHLRGNNLVMWHAIQQLKSAGAESLSFGRTALGNEGLRKFKLGWNAREEMVQYLKYDLVSETPLVEVDKTEGVHNTFFRFLPTWLSEKAGSLIYPHIA